MSTLRSVEGKTLRMEKKSASYCRLLIRTHYRYKLEEGTLISAQIKVNVGSVSFRFFHVKHVVQLDMNIHALEKGIPAVSKLITQMGLYLKNIFGAHKTD